ncbi:MAG TPA: ABC transporter ATP-binding protein [Epsilonproteobacteria bacterium]|nr:ABC transporter ATP-binding protein [Campylobacterota bacterium]
MLKIDNYSNTILKDISFTLEADENLIILGSNGVGKTTLAKVLCGVTPTSSVSIEGINPSKVYGQKRAKLINYIPPKLDVFDEFITVKEFLELGFISGVVRVQHPTIDEVLKKLHISHLADKACKALSSGESQLLLIASALLHDARYTIFDEPTANLDPQKMQLLFGLLKDEATFKSKIIITHNLDLAYKLGYDILFLEEGKVKFYGTSHDFFAQEHLDALYDGSVEKQAHNIVVKL